MNYTDCMIDLETLGDTPDSIPCQMGVVFFDLKDPDRQIRGGLVEIDPATGAELGLIQTTSTLKWWENLGRPIPGQDPATASSLIRVLHGFHQDFTTLAKESARVWSRGNSFDLAILKIAYKRAFAAPPWQFWRERDVRSYLEALRVDSTKNNHDALDDCMNQVGDLQLAAAL